MKKRIVKLLLMSVTAGLLATGCGAAGSSQAASAEKSESAEASESMEESEDSESSENTQETKNTSTSENADETNDSAASENVEGAETTEESENLEELTDVDQSDVPADFLQNQCGKVKFKDFDEAISYLQDGQGYATVKAYGSDEELLAVADNVFLADNTTDDASIYAVDGDQVRFLGVVSGNGSSFPLRVDENNIIYGGDNHTYQTYFLTSNDNGVPLIMQKDYIYDNFDGTYGGFTRKDDTPRVSDDFVGGQEEFEALLSERDSLPAIEFTIVGNPEESTD
ncbi:hypothetical protein [Butyrivibrio sp. WCE2006]|uniref:hypothetical protein n=1 Tax=Butyrivibrio sp. WCE2006 TaxID=1410611 RepID=UPI0005D1CB0F|nr:hypothetical protein [Butyrivibrio sp. WCE2006]